MFTLEQIKENRRKWVEALRSGRYEQTQSGLRIGNGFCCLGVLADIAGCKWVNDRTADGEPSYTPAKAIEFVGLVDRRASFNGMQSLAVENDEGAPFTRIADIIESSPPGLFLTDEEITASLNTGKG